MKPVVKSLYIRGI